MDDNIKKDNKDQDNEQASTIAFLLDVFTKTIDAIDVTEEVEPAIVFRRRKEK